MFNVYFYPKVSISSNVFFVAENAKEKDAK